MFDFNHMKYDFWSIYESVKKYNPIGIKKDTYGFFHSYPGIKELADIVNDNLIIEEHFQKRWVSFEMHLRNIIQQPLFGTTYGSAPSFSSYIEIEKIISGEMTRLKELNFFVSLIGKFYTVIGHDRNDIIIDKRHYHTSNCLIVSPEKEYAETFNILCAAIENHFKGYRFVPFDIYSQAIVGLDVCYTDENLNTVYHALFNNHIKDFKTKIIGNVNYKMEDWIKEGYVETESSWTIYPPGTSLT
jgi:hypothetical protein